MRSWRKPPTSTRNAYETRKESVGWTEVKIGILNGGGDCAGLNAVTRAVVKRAEEYGWEVLGIKHGWEGFLKGDSTKLTYSDVKGIINVGGTLLKSSRTNPIKHSEGIETILENSKRLGLDAVICVGGDDTLGVAALLYKRGMRIVGVPKTMDNDLSSTDYTFGFDSAVNEATHAIDNLRTTAESHDRVFVVEIMGREAGWVAAYSGIASGANLIIVPEEPFEIDEVVSFVKSRHETGEKATVIVISEGAVLKQFKEVEQGKVDEFGHVRLGGIGQFLGDEIEKRTKYDTRVAVLGHMIRGGSPTAFDRVLSTRFGLAAVDLIKDSKFGLMVSLRGTKIIAVSLEESTSRYKLLDSEILNVIKAMSY
jgi:ATP-dependent phosphofructokinase / diphosphate-dependent phosphofructokinase